MEILSAQACPASGCFDALPRHVDTPELKMALGDHEKFSLLRQLQEQAWEGVSLCTIDGVRADYADGWG